MSSLLTLLVAISLTLLSGFRGWYRASLETELRSRPVYHGLNFGLWVALPMLAASCFWLVSDSLILKPSVLSVLTGHNQQLLVNADFRYLEITQIANGLLSDQGVDATTTKAIEHYHTTKQNTDTGILALLIFAGLMGFRSVNRRYSSAAPAREQVERIIKALLAASSGVAVLTTAG
ncbi:MAG: phosphate ABC transporter permease family protein, partial [Gammaproteobacteria bacterium]|nr:phosphate ABC transporter permease family protein [Gammaproteobacteria bacterium]